MIELFEFGFDRQSVESIMMAGEAMRTEFDPVEENERVEIGKKELVEECLPSKILIPHVIIPGFDY